MGEKDNIADRSAPGSTGAREITGADEAEDPAWQQVRQKVQRTEKRSLLIVPA